MDKSNIQTTIKRYFQGSLTDPEMEQLSDFLKEDEGGEFRKAKQAWSLNPDSSEVVEKNWLRLQYRIHQAEMGGRSLVLPQKMIIRVLTAAALLIFGLLGGGVVTYLYTGNPSRSEELVFETPRGEKSVVTLPDGTTVWLNAKSKLVYHSFSGKNREVDLTGEAYFKVAHNEQAPFMVNVGNCEIKVLGTTFNVMAYNEFGRMEITLISGRIDVKSDGGEQVMKPGQALVIKDHQARLLDGNVSQASGWVDKKFNFQNIPLSELMMRLENWYDVDISFDNQSGKEVNFTGTFKNEETIWQVLDAIKIYTPIEYKKTNLRKIKITVR
jgi:ferric-dicitrate binding protein FerR (iron transport regulator)